MTETRHFCDRCGCVILADRTALRVECGPLLGRFDVLEFCPDCATQFVNWCRAAQTTPTLVSQQR
jgi:ribosomal protein S27AE